MNESYFEQLKSVVNDRLHPERMKIAYIGILAYSGVVTLFSSKLIRENLIIGEWWNTLLSIEIKLIIVQFLAFLFFMWKNNAMKFQKTQLVIVTFSLLKMSLDTYFAFFLMCKDRSAPDYLVNIGKWLLVGGIVYLIISIIRAISRVKNGHFQKGGRGLYNFLQSQGYVSLPIIFGVVVVGSVIYNNLSSLYIGNNVQTMYILGIATLLQYAIAMIIPEFFLLIYCKFRFSSFEAKPIKYLD